MASLVDLAKQTRPILEKAVESLDDNDALIVKNFFQSWTPSTQYKVGVRVNSRNTLYKCLQEHTAQLGQEPSKAPGLWAEVDAPAPETISEWKKPENSNGYAIGDKVRHIEKIWESTINSNIWEPGVENTNNLWVEVYN